jgi:hypothetical protein
MKKAEWLPLALLFGTLVALEAVSAWLSWHTLGDIPSALYWLALALNVPVACLAWFHRPAAALVSVALALAIVPYQFALGHRWLRVQAEAANVVAYAYEQKLATGQYPADLSGYTFRDPSARPFIQGYSAGPRVPGGFQVTYCVGTPSTSHWYSPATGWGYYPD